MKQPIIRCVVVYGKTGVDVSSEIDRFMKEGYELRKAMKINQMGVYQQMVLRQKPG